MAGNTQTSALETLTNQISVTEVAVASTNLDAEDGPFSDTEADIILVKPDSDIATSTDSTLYSVETTVALDEANGETIEAMAVQDADVWRAINHSPIAKENNFVVDYELDLEVVD